MRQLDHLLNMFILSRRKNYFIILLELTICLLLSTSVSNAQQQSFRRKPEDVEVKLGDTAILRCEVDNQAGNVQWTRGGFALGFSREVPGFDRYTMVGEASRGVHNLRIVNVTLSDINEYQCQVGPFKTNKAIRADAKLYVLVPPKLIQILNHAPDATITLKERDPTEFECVVKEARPAASITWYRNDVPFKPESKEDFVDEVEVVEDGVIVKKNTTRSKIKILPNSEDDRARFTCEGRHPALSRPERVTVNLSVQYPPNAPRIDGYTEGETVRVNESLTLTCISRGGNPLAQLIWFKNDANIDSSYSTRGKESRNELTFTASTRDNLASYRCEASNIMSIAPKIATVVLTVYFPPKEVNITGPKEAKVGDTVTLTCSSSPSNPQSDMVWFKGGAQLQETHTSSLVSAEGGWATFSNVSFRIEPHDRREVYSCQAINGGIGVTKTATHTINVIQPPGQPRIYRSVSNITAGQRQTLTCTSSGGHPTANLTWYRDGKKIPAHVTQEGGIATSELIFDANMTDNGIIYKCEAKSKAISTPLSETVSFSVLFPPSSVSITSKPKKLKEGTKGWLTCESSSSNPPARLSFLKGSLDISSHLNQSIKDGKHGGKKSSITLEIDLSAEHHGAGYTCEATNEAISMSVHNSIILEVSYKPKFKESDGEKYSVAEGESRVISVEAKGNPSEIKYKWSKNGSPVKNSTNKVGVSGRLLNFTEVTRKDRGKWECEASNSEGSTILVIDLDVQYPASIQAPETIIVGQNESAFLECLIDANPLDESMVVWKFGEAEITRPTLKNFNDKKAYLTVPNVSISDAGEYFCFVNNSIGAPVNKSIFLIVKHKPDIDKSPQIAKAASNKGASGKLICRAKGAPNVTFSWDKKDGVPLNSNSTKYSIHTRMVDRMNFESVLSINSVDSSDYGIYRCLATNELHSDSHDIALDVTSAPDSPNRFRTVNSTDNSVTLSWDPGFNGGFNQSFNILYYEVGTDHKKYVDVYPPNTNVFTVNGLSRGTTYSFRIQAFNQLGRSNYTEEKVEKETLNEADRLSALSGRSRRDIPSIVIIIVSVIGTLILMLNIVIVSYFLYKKNNSASKSKHDEASEEGSSKSATIEMYAPSSYNETVTGETLSSISEKSASYSHGETHDDYIDDGGVGGKGSGGGMSTYLVDHINHHHSYPYRESNNSSGLRASTLPRQPKHYLISPIDSHIPSYAEDDGYVEAFKKNSFLPPPSNATPLGDMRVSYGRTLGRPTSSRPPQVPPIPELYNIPPEAQYAPYPSSHNYSSHSPPLNNSPHTQLRPSLSHDLLLHSTNTQGYNNPTNYNETNGRIYNSRPILSPQRNSVLSTFAPNPSPNMEHEGHLV